MTQKIITILTKSYKNDGYCVAGIDQHGKWIRLVSDKDGGALSKQYCTFNVLDVIDINVNNASLRHHPENAIIVDGFKKIGQTTIADLLNKHPNILCDTEYIFFDATHRLTSQEIENINNSLLIAKVKKFKTKSYESYGSKYEKNRGYFTYNGNDYSYISITDPNYKSQYLSCAEAYIVVSLPPEAYKDDYYYKFIASIFPI